jgi:apolipoprotein D and lipocalin family protein
VGERGGVAMQVVSSVDLNRYTGIWYEIARLPNSFEKGLVCTTATYTLKENGKIRVVNEGYRGSKEGKRSKATGTAWVPDPETPGKLKVSFFWPFSSDYWILELDEKEYKYAMVGGSSTKYLWILCREPDMDEEIYSDLIESARRMGFEVDRLYRVPQVCN